MPPAGWPLMPLAFTPLRHCRLLRLFSFHFRRRYAIDVFIYEGLFDDIFAAFIEAIAGQHFFHTPHYAANTGCSRHAADTPAIRRRFIDAPCRLLRQLAILADAITLIFNIALAIYQDTAIAACFQHIDTLHTPLPH
jgi:hypothetical protein